MNSILANDPIEEMRSGFWARQIDSVPTSGQVVFDVVFGVLMPVFCFYFDPGIVRGGFSTPIGEMSFFIYVFSGLAIVTLSIWLGFGPRIGSAKGIVCGMLVAAAIISTSIGVLILPLTLIGLFVVIGVLGFVPFITGFVYLRNGLRAVRQAGDRSPRMATVILSALLALGIPGAAQWAVIEIVEQSVAEILDEKSPSFDASVSMIRMLRSIVDTDRFVREYEKEPNPERRERLGRAYKEITGVEIETRLSILND